MARLCRLRGVARAAQGAVGVVLLAVVLAGCGSDSGGDDDALAAAQDEGTLQIGYVSERPYAYEDDEGELTGESVEVARTIFERLGIDEVEGVLVEFDSIIPALQAGRFDVIATGMFITPERCQEILFSDPDFVALQSFGVAEGNPLGLESLEDVVNSDASLGVLSASVQLDWAQRAGVPESQITSFPDSLAGVESVLDGRIDAYLLSTISLTPIVEQAGGGVEVTTPFVPMVEGEKQFSTQGYGFANEDTELRDAFDKELDGLQSSGELAEIAAPFGFTERELGPAERLTAEELCAEPR